MPGFLLADDAISARKQQFDDWADEQRRAAEQAARQVQQQAQQVAQQQQSEVTARATQFQDWVSQQTAQQQPTAPAAPVAPVPSPLAAVETAAPPAVVGEAPDVAARARQFQDWVTQSAQQAAQPAVPTPVQQPSLPPAEEPATQTDTVAVGPDLGGKWKTSFDHGATYTGSYRTGTPHRGIDLVPHQGGIGTSVEAFHPGTVTGIHRDKGAGGNMVYVQDDQGLTHAYMHLQGARPGLKVGDTVNRGDQIATMGETGTEGSPHLHYEVRKNAATGDPLNALIDPRPYMTGGGQQRQPGTTPPSRFQPSGAPMSKTTAELSGGGPASGMTERAQSIMSEAGQAAAAFGGDAAKAVQAVLVTEGGMNNARGDSGQSAGPLQFYGGGGQLNNFAKNLGVPLEDAKRWVEENPVAAVRWALGTPDAPGYLGRALVDGISKGLTGADLATHIQRTGQVSVSPERAGQNFLSLFGQGQEAVRTAGGGLVEGALEAGRQVAGRAGELVSQGQQLAESGARGAQDAWSQLDTAQSRAHAESERWLAEQRARGEEWDAQRQRRDLDWQRSMDEQMRGFGERAQEFTAPVTQGVDQLAASPMARAFEESPYNPIRDVVRTAQAIPENLGRLGQGVEGAGREATRQQSEGLIPQLGVEAARFGAGLFGQELPRELETGLRQAVPNAVRGFESDVGGVVSAFLKSSGVASPEMTIELPGLGAVPVADLIGLGANMMIPTGAEARFGRTALRTSLTEGARAGRPDMTLPLVRRGGEAASMAASQVARWARAGVSDIAVELAQSPIGRSLSDDALVDVATRIKTALPEVQDLLRSRTGPGVGRAAAGAGEDVAEQVIGPGDVGRRVADLITSGQPAQAGAMAAARGATGLGGGVAGWESAPAEERRPAFEVETPFGQLEIPSGMRVGRAIVGTGAGLAAPGIAQAALSKSQLRQDMLERLRSAGIATAAPQPSRPFGRDVGTLADVTKQAILTNPAGRALDIVGNTIELLRQPIALAMGGQGPEAVAGVAAIARALPEAFQNAVQAMRGHQVGTLGQGAQDIGRSKPIFRFLAAGDVFTRTLGEYQGMASRAVSMLNKAGIEPGTPQAEKYLADHVDELHREAVRSGTGSVFGSAQRGANASPLDELMSKLSDVKEGWLKSPDRLKQGLGALLDLNIPFSGTPSRVLQIGLQRIPGVTQSVGAARIARALQKGDTFAAQKALGEITVETLIQLRIAQGIADGNITGPDDPEHPSSIQVNGEWYPLRTLGVWGMPAGIMAAFAESWEKTGREPDPQTTERFAAALNASMEPLLDAVPGFSMMNMLAAVGRGGFTGAVEQQGQDAVNRLLSPALLAQVNNKLDPVMRDVHKRGWESLWEPTQAKTPFLSKYLPPKLDPTTGEPMTRGVTALGGTVKTSSSVRAELAHLKREYGYDLNPPTDKPTSITIRGVTVPVQEGSAEQRAMVQARGQFLTEAGQQIQTPRYQRMTPDQKAKMWSSLIDRSARVQTRAWQQSVDPERAARILATGKRVVGRVRDVEDEDQLINRQVAIANQLRRQQMARTG